MLQHIMHKIGAILDVEVPSACFNFAALALRELEDKWPTSDDAPKLAKGICRAWPERADVSKFMGLRSKYVFVLLN